MGLFDRKPVAPAKLERPKGPPPQVGDRVGIVFTGNDELFLTGYLIAIHNGTPFFCVPDYEHGKPFFANYRLDQMLVIDGPPLPGEVITMTDDDLTPGAKVLIFDRKHNKTHKGEFVCEYMGYRCVRYSRGGPATLPADDVQSIMRTYTAEDVMKMREATGLGMVQCKDIIQGESLRQQIRTADDIEDLRMIVKALVDKVYPEDYHTQRALDAMKR